MANSSRRSSGPVLPMASVISPSSRFDSSSPSDTPSSLIDPGHVFHRSSSPTRVKLHGLASSSVRFSIGSSRSRSPSRSMAVSPRDHVFRKPNYNPIRKKTCTCSPSTHPGSFRCSLHKNCDSGQSISYSPNRLNARRSVMANSLVRIGTVEGDLVKRALAQLIRPSSHQQRRRADFQPRHSRLSIVSTGYDF
ncbi:unnamed protein product [Camellia sinensis]|uniref:Serine-rich protein-like protein n=1 Tax=Camellia sinensis var. sinensis TaxID=542762 RepID=A0A4V3WNU9_CAMSN|nr:uncharacterized protein LOC114273913 [Camellia sinensis]THG13737.1 hypothetical protein TEA_019671 [Camellia sinensis var. sinensis]